MSQWNTIVLSFFLVTYLPFFWFLGMRVEAGVFLKKNQLCNISVDALIPGWADICTKVFFSLHYCFFLVILTLIDWLHGLAAFGAGILVFIFLPLQARSYAGIFSKSVSNISMEIQNETPADPPQFSTLSILIVRDSCNQKAMSCHENVLSGITWKKEAPRTTPGDHCK